MCKGNRQHNALSQIQSRLLKLTDAATAQNPGTSPVALVEQSLAYWLSTPVDQLAATADSKRIRQAQFLIGLLADVQSENGKGVNRG